MATPFGQAGSYGDSMGTPFGQSGSFVDSMGTPFGQTSKSTKPRNKSSDTSKMNKIYKPKASPGPIGSAANVREGRVPKKATRPSAESFSKPNKGTRPMGESTKSGKKTINRGSWRQSRGD